MEAKLLQQLIETLPAFSNGSSHLPEKELLWLERAKLLLAGAAFEGIEAINWQGAVSKLEYNGLRHQGREEAKELDCTVWNIPPTGAAARRCRIGA
jgi:hypothetical protein